MSSVICFFQERQSHLAAAPPSSALNVPGDQDPELPAYGEMLVNTLTMLTVMVIALIVVAWLLRWYMKRRLPRGSSEQIECLGRRQLEPGKHLYLIRVGTQELLIGSGSEGLRLISKIDSNEAHPSFKDVLSSDAIKPPDAPSNS